MFFSSSHNYDFKGMVQSYILVIQFFRVFLIVVNHVGFIIKYKDKTKKGRILLQPFIKIQINIPALPFSSSPCLPFFFSYSPLIAVIPGSFLPSIYSSIAPPPVET